VRVFSSWYIFPPFLKCAYIVGPAHMVQDELFGARNQIMIFRNGVELWYFPQIRAGDASGPMPR
jgi:hypothetical protein